MEMTTENGPERGGFRGRLPPGFTSCRVCKDSITNAALGVCPLCCQQRVERATEEETLARQELRATRGIAP